MANFFRVMGNYKTSVLMTMQTDAQWDSVDTSMKTIIRKLLNFQMDYRPESEDEAKRIALLLGEYDPMGAAFPYDTTARSAMRSASTSIGDTWSDMEGTGEGDSTSTRKGLSSNDVESLSPHFDPELGTSFHHDIPGFSFSDSSSSDAGEGRSTQRTKARVAGGSASESSTRGETDTVTTLMHITGSQEQHFLRVQALLDGTLMKRHQALVLSEDRDGRRTPLLVTMDRFPSAPEIRDGTPVLAQYRAAVARFTKRTTRTPYKRFALLPEDDVYRAKPQPKPAKPTTDPKPPKKAQATQKPTAPTAPPSWEE